MTPDRDLDRCLCGATVPARPGGERSVAGQRVEFERGSCTGCGLQLVRRPGERWREIRG